MSWRVIMAGLILWLTQGACAAHESPLPSATLVLRDGGHLVLTLRLDLARALHRTLQPESTPMQALSAFAAMEPARFAGLWERATSRWAQECAVLVQGRRVAAQRWSWPSAQEAQSLVQRQLMPQLAGTHTDHEWGQAQAEFTLGTESRDHLQLRLPAALRPLSLTTVRPRQQWSGESEQPIKLLF